MRAQRVSGLLGVVRTYVKAQGPGCLVTLDTLAQKCSGWPRSSYSGAMAQLVKEGLIEHVSRGCWQLPGDGRTEVQVQDAVRMRDGTILVQIDGVLYEAVER